MGWWLGLAPATLEFWVRFPNERNQGKQAHPVLKYRVPHGSHGFGFGSGFGIGFTLTHLLARAPLRHPPFTPQPFPPRSLVCGGQPSPHKSRLVVSHSTCPPLSSSPHTHSIVLGTAVINNNWKLLCRSFSGPRYRTFSGPIARPPPSPEDARCSHPQTGPPDSATSPVIVLYYSRALCAEFLRLLFLQAHRETETHTLHWNAMATQPI
jgi:hypothetical protein